MAEAALAMRDAMSREDEPSFVIKDPKGDSRILNAYILYEDAINEIAWRTTI